MAEMRVAVRGQWVDFESTLTDKEAVACLRELPGDFPDSLCSQHDERGLSVRQMAWAHKLAIDSLTPEPALELPGVRALIDAAAEHLKFPKVNLVTEDGQRVRLSRAGDRSKNPGFIHIADGRPFGENRYFGRIDLAGAFLGRRDCPADVVELLQALELDPEGIATAYGQRTGNCCFCRRELTDKRSVDVGYGPVCADHFGLPWGAVKGQLQLVGTGGA